MSGNHDKPPPAFGCLFGLAIAAVLWGALWGFVLFLKWLI